MCTEHLLTNRDKGKQINYSMLVFGNQKAQNTCPENNKACRLMPVRDSPLISNMPKNTFIAIEMQQGIKMSNTNTARKPLSYLCFNIENKRAGWFSTTTIWLWTVVLLESKMVGEAADERFHCLNGQLCRMY